METLKRREGAGERCEAQDEHNESKRTEKGKKGRPIDRHTEQARQSGEQKWKKKMGLGPVHGCL